MDKDNILVWMEILRTRLKFRPDIVTRWQKLQYLVIDEISMLSSRLFTRLELIATECRRSMNKLSEQKAFGGIQLVIFGDFFQLPPVVHPSEVGYNKPKIYKCIRFTFILHSYSVTG